MSEGEDAGEREMTEGKIRFYDYNTPPRHYGIGNVGRAILCCIVHTYNVSLRQCLRAALKQQLCPEQYYYKFTDL